MKQFISLYVISSIQACDNYEHASLIPKPRPGGQSFVDAAKAAREILVVLQRNDAIQSEHGQWRVPACIFELFRIGSTCGCNRIRYTFDAKRARHQLCELIGFHQPAQADAFS